MPDVMKNGPCTGTLRDGSACKARAAADGLHCQHHALLKTGGELGWHVVSKGVYCASREDDRGGVQKKYGSAYELRELLLQDAKKTA